MIFLIFQHFILLYENMHPSRGLALVNLSKKRTAEQKTHHIPCKKRLFEKNPVPPSFNEGKLIIFGGKFPGGSFPGRESSRVRIFPGREPVWGKFFGELSQGRIFQFFPQTF